MLQCDDIIQKIKAYNPHANTSLITKAYEFCKKAHEGQMRLSGQPFFIHPLEVANTLAEMQLDIDSIAAGILHDTIEDTQATKEQIKALFGNNIAELVDGVTKLSKLQFNTKEERQAENFRKMILAMSKDIRVIIIKLADRLHNLRTLQFMPEEKQMSIAQETMDIYAPLANRFGIQWMKVQLEDLSFRFLNTETYKQIEKKMERLKANREEYIERVSKTVNDCLKYNIKDYNISGRMKHIYSVYRKMERQNISFDQVHDLIAFRILTNSLEECYEALGLIHSLWKPVPGRFKDYIAMPKANNYQSLHTTVICLEGERVEFQIRTYKMHEIADKGIAAHWKYKENGQLDISTEATFQWLRELLEWQKEVKDSYEFMDTVKQDLFASEIYVFTPKGDVRALPYGSSPIDFAYAIHSDVGNHCAGARINQKLVPLNYKLKNGDEVEIITSAHRFPSKDWLNMVTSSRARARIRQYLKVEQSKKSFTIGKSIFEDECSKHHLVPADILKSPALNDYLVRKGVMPNEESFYSAVGYGKISVPVMLGHINPEQSKESPAEEEGLIRRIFKKVSKQTKNLVLVGGLDEVLVTFGKCCLPIPGDSIVGFITRGRGVTVHRVECPKGHSIDPERRVSASWNKNVEQDRVVKLKIACLNRTGMLAAVAQAISEKKINITKAVVQTTRDEKALIYLNVTLKHIKELHALMKAVQKLKGIISIEREMG